VLLALALLGRCGLFGPWNRLLLTLACLRRRLLGCGFACRCGTLFEGLLLLGLLSFSLLLALLG